MEKKENGKKINKKEKRKNRKWTKRKKKKMRKENDEEKWKWIWKSNRNGTTMEVFPQAGRLAKEPTKQLAKNRLEQGKNGPD